MDYPGRDGVRLAYTEVGEGRPVILLHGHQERASIWTDSGLAGRLAARGHRVILPDLRAHGNSSKSHDPACYPPDALADDGFALVDHLGLTDYDLAGHSLGGRTVIQMLIRGATPRRAVVSGQGMLILRPAADRTRWYRTFFPAVGTGTFAPGSDEQETEDWLLSMDGDPQALLLLLDSWADITAEALGTFPVPVLVLTGADEHSNETGPALAATFQDGRHRTLPGDHFTVKESPQYEAALSGFLLS